MSESIVLPFELDEDITDITDSEQLCPGVYYVAGPRVEDGVPVEYYAVERATAPLSEAAKSYGRPSETDSDILLYRLGDPTSGRDVVKYEVMVPIILKMQRTTGEIIALYVQRKIIISLFAQKMLPLFVHHLMIDLDLNPLKIGCVLRNEGQGSANRSDDEEIFNHVSVAL